MPTIAIVDGVALLIYPRDHMPPHVHAVFAEYRCKILIYDGAIIEGKLPRQKLKTVKQWIAQHRAEVSVAWNTIQNGGSIEGQIK